MIRLTRFRDGLLLPVVAQPGASRNAVRGEQNGALKVSVTQVAEKGKANKALVAVIAKSLGLRKSQVELVSGTTAKEKGLLIHDADRELLQDKLNAIGKV